MDFSFISYELFEKILYQLILGFVQGITEFLPISSTAHLVVVPALLGWGDPGVSTIASLQLGSIIAVFIYFRKDISDILKGLSFLFIQNKQSHPKAKLALAIFIGNIPILLAGLLIKLFWPDYQTSVLRTIPSIAYVSILMALILGLSEKFARRIRTLESIKANDGIFIGLSQILALIPGVSRSGITISTSLLSGLNRDSSARFSFLLGIPAVTLAGLVEFREVIYHSSLIDFTSLSIGIVSAAIFSWLAIDFLIKFLKNNSIIIFVYYRLMFGILTLYWFYQ